MDWFRSCTELVQEPPIFITDNYGSEGFTPLLKPTDKVKELLIIDALLPARSSSIGHVWRNLLKLLVIPFQVFRLRRVLSRIDSPFVFAHSTYYAFLASFCNTPYFAAPQGSEVLVRPHRSRFYRRFLVRSVKYARGIIVDSAAMAAGLKNIANASASIIQNGINVLAIRECKENAQRDLITSIRGFDRNYRIVEILTGRDHSAAQQRLTFCCPFVEDTYNKEIEKHLHPDDVVHGRLPRAQMYELLKRSIAVVSIPQSDSSPRSVYEAIFCGAAVICTHSPYVDELPACMRRRVVLVNIADPDWFAKALGAAREISSTPYLASSEATDLYDQVSSMNKVLILASSSFSANSID